MTCLWIGETRAKTRACFVASVHHLTFSLGSSSVKLSALGTRLSSMTPVITVKSEATSFSGRMLMRFAMARAVSGWSPVTITTLTPALDALRTASSTPSLGGSSMPYRPTNSKLFRGKLQSVGPVPSRGPGGHSLGFRGLLAMHRTRRACAMRTCMVFSITCIAALSLLTEQNLSTRSGAPFMTAKKPCWPFWPCTVSIHLFSELNGISKFLSFASWALVARTLPCPPCTSVHARMMATSVGEPVHLSHPSSTLHSAPLLRIPHNANVLSFSAAWSGKRSRPSSRLTVSSPCVVMPAAPGARGMTRS
mmetsp:Transcript_26715/g.60835  ORF Transcript_26715/g.60835 Transcript_26715/m.60835 type:complete len:307 (-) Transcript_26715:1427-2347(-)